ncbi:ribonucleotide-diphosphate reductase subunit beta [Fictibacillus nanhaiensis]|uniref:ribonucleotide-diphosphate reductase subunit beta n=1 Tax=Fictibacillus nanhaiensis TaxID=742169 RepID=UPI002E1A3D8C|nr:ribonucleotide-diphosphate reductase subunit beta [Fictibacillus nanhaiensis]
MTIQPFRVFDGGKPNVASKVFGGDASGIRDWDNIKYPEMLEINKQLFAEYWIEDEVKLGKDLEDYKNKLNNNEREVYNYISGKLNWLDSIATDFNFILGYLCTDPSVRSNIALINSFEQLHNRSYQYLTATMLTQEQKEQAFEHIKTIPQLVKRNEHVISKIQTLVDETKLHIQEDAELNQEFLQTIFEGILANLVLEGLYFSGGFVYFHSLARDQKMIESNNMINLIRADETQHSVFYGMLLQILMKENPGLNTKENMNFAVEFVKKAVELEKEWATHIFANIDTLQIKEYNDYVEYLANVICRNAGIEQPFPNNAEIKSRWIITYGSKSRSDSSQIVTRTDFLQGNAINYTHESGEDFDL